MLFRNENDDFTGFLTVEDVERISGCKRIRRIEFDPTKFLGSELNFVSESGKKLLCVDFFSAAQFGTYKKISPPNLMVSLQDIGDEACAGQDPVDHSSVLLFRKGKHTVFMNTAAEDKIKSGTLNLDQLIQIGKVVASRIG